MEEGPMNSPINNNMINSIASEDASDHHHLQEEQEESGWTAYLEDFSCSNGSFISSQSLVSDAAWKGTDNIDHHVLRKLNFKNIKRSCNNKRYSYGDDDLEDTASSPVNSPKVSTMKQMEVNYRSRIDDVAAGNFLRKQAGWNNFSEMGTEEKNVKDIVIDDQSRNINTDEYNKVNHHDLRQRGLCLVPMSALMNYLG